MRAFLVLLTATAFAATMARAQDDAWPPGSAMHTGGLEVKRRDAALTMLGGLHGRLLKLTRGAEGPGLPDSRLIAALEAQQAAWKRYIVDECEVIGALSGAGGSWPSTYAVRCQANLAELRARRTRAAIRCVEGLEARRRGLEANRCLYQLAPMAVPLR